MRTVGIGAAVFILVVSAGCGSSSRAIAVPASATLSTSSQGRVTSISCAAPGDCAAGGYYPQRAHHKAFVVSEANGTWETPIEVPGAATLGRGARVLSISCAAPGDCAAGGRYSVARNSLARNLQAFVVTETNGKWGDAIKVPGTATLNVGRNAGVVSMSCAAPGDCAAGGSYTDHHGHQEAFVVSETSGSWGDAIEVPGTALLNRGGGARVLSISCATAGNCVAGGYLHERDLRYQAFVVSETNGKWGNAIEVPGTATSKYSHARVVSVSCAAAGECAAGGYFLDPRGDYKAFVASEKNGSWGSAITVPLDGFAEVNSISCSAPGDCAAGGYYDALPPNYYPTAGEGAFVVTETNGKWGKPIDVPGTAAVDAKHSTRDESRVESISCGAAGECVAGGFHFDQSRNSRSEVFVVSETNGRWGNAIELRGAAVLHGDFRGSRISISCAAPGACAAGGYLVVHGAGHALGTGRRRAFVAGETNGTWGTALRIK